MLKPHRWDVHTQNHGDNWRTYHCHRRPRVGRRYVRGVTVKGNRFSVPREHVFYVEELTHV